MARPTAQPKNTFTLCRDSNAPGQVIGRDQILSRYFALACLTPTETKDNIAGQLKALDSLCEELALTTPETHVKQQPPPDVYRSRWMEEDMKNLS